MPTVQMQTSNTLNPTETYGSTGAKLDTNDSNVSAQQVAAQNSESGSVSLTWRNMNIYNQARTEATYTNPMMDYVDPRSNDRLNKDFKSVSNPEGLQTSIEKSVDRIKQGAISELGANKYGNISIRTLKEYNDLYPRFKVSSRPDPKTGYKTFTPYVFDLAQNTPLKENEINTFINSIAAPAIAQSMSA